VRKEEMSATITAEQKAAMRNGASAIEQMRYPVNATTVAAYARSQIASIPREARADDSSTRFWEEVALNPHVVLEYIHEKLT
jgi:hypothetical protein